MPTKQSLNGVKERIFIHHMLGASLAGLAVFSLGFVLIPTLHVEASATTNLSASVLWNSISLELDPDYGNGSTSDSGHGDIDFGTITPTSNDGSNKGTMRVAKKTIGINTSGKYYAVYLSMANPATGTTVNDLLLDGTSNIPIPAVGDGSTTGTWTNPIIFAGSAWGYAVPGSPITNGFDASSSYSAYPINSSAGNITSDLTYAGNSSVYNTTKWAAVPVVNDTALAQIIWKQETVNTNGFGAYTNDAGIEVTGDTEHNHFDVYFATMVDTDTIAGEYSNQIVYTALASARSLDKVSTNVKRDKSFGGEGDTVHLEFDLATSASDLDANDLTVAIVKHSVASLISSETLSSDLTISSNDYAECANISNVIFGENGASLDCELPAPIDGILGKGDNKGEYDFWIKVNNYNYNYISRYKDGNNNPVASFTYAGLQSTTDTEGENFVVTEMQDMSGGICKNTNMWGSTTGDDARIYDYLGEQKETTTDPETEEETTVYNGHALLAAGVDELGISSFKLIDNRDQKPYLVRRLADESCWMVQNLDLDLSTIGTLTSDSSDVSEDWTPNTETIDNDYSTTNVAKFKDAGLKYLENGSVSEDQVFNIAHATRYYGGYYSWLAVAAESANTSLLPPSSICPKGWRVQGYYNNGVWDALAKTYNLGGGESTSFQNAQELPLSLTVSGFYSPDGFRREHIFYHTGGRRNLQTGVFYIYTSGSYGVSDGPGLSPANRLFTLRCLARD